LGIDIIPLQEYDEIDTCLTDEEYSILSSRFKNEIGVIELGNSRYRIKAKQYVGNIIIPHHKITINPKIDKLNYLYMLPYAYDLEFFKKDDFEYLKHAENFIFDLLVRNLIQRLNRIYRRGALLANYYEIEENLPYVKGRILHRTNTQPNSMLQHTVYCRYSDFGHDNLENRIIKYTLYQLLKTGLEEVDLYRKTKFLLHYLEPVSLIAIDFNHIQKINYNRLTKDYEPIINLCQLILTKTSVNLRSTGELRFSSFLVDMNELFEYFIVGLLIAAFKGKGLIVKGGKRKEHSYSDIQMRTEMKPDIVIWNGHLKRLLVIDTKYKEEVTSHDLNQIWIYCVVLGLPLGILLYPEHCLFFNDERTLVKTGIQASIRSIDLNKHSYNELQEECNKFICDIEGNINELCKLSA
jgi:5-methylcytosine-specific restriction enzyme subunit McrC